MYALRNVPLLVENRRRCRVTFVSAEPLLGPINPVAWPSIDWLILGGESGPNARPCDVAWILEALTAAAVAGIECFVKQLGENAVNLPIHPQRLGLTWLQDRKGGDPSEWPSELQVQNFPVPF